MRFFRGLAKLVAWLVLLLAFFWACLAVWIDGPVTPALRLVCETVLIIVGVAALALLRPAWRAGAALSALVLVVALWWTNIPPSNDRDWQPDVAHLPRAVLDGDKVTIYNVRDFDYRSETDFTEHWETRTYDLSQIDGFDLFISYWGPTLIAHTISSWEFKDGSHLAISIETRKEKGETYSAVLGFFRQYELYYVVADERDVIGVRTDHRGEHVFLYRLRMSPESARAILLDYLATVNSLAQQPQWYNALTHNCTTTIRDHVRAVTPTRPWGWKLLVNGYLDELGYERGTINTTMPFPELKARSEITEKAKAADGDSAFSQRIREGLPARPAASPSTQ